MLRQQAVLPLAFLKVFAGVDEQHVIGLFALLQHQNADWDAGGVEQIGGQADHGVDIAIFQQFGRMRSSAPPRNSTPWGRMIAIVPSWAR